MNSSSNITVLPPNNIFVFGSNLAGRHGLGTAKLARKKFGAIYGIGVGLQGHSYAIPTKDYNIITLPLRDIHPYVQAFLEFARKHTDLIFHVTPVGCGLAGYKPKDIAPMFRDSPSNVLLPKAFTDVFISSS